ncbi:HofO [Enterobacter sp. RHBSTW-00175]|uniref:HofO family protein n=1 Tax=Enterobacter sp. RHBSTW-00175 TaxID=2742639 RepID=UPI002174FD8E|nr:HofO [Enterobacter sp. RHBSTW-00175]
MLTLVAWGAVVKPLHSRQVALNVQLADTLRTRATLWTMAMRYSPAAEQGNAQIRQGFSPLDFQHGGTKLVHWKPSRNGGELTLDADWAQIPDVFTRLAQRDVNVEAFDMSPQGAQLRLSIQLERLHAE